jgi:(2Fe-2S) ferredoxin
MKTQPSPYLCHIFICTNVRENNPDNPGCGAKGGTGLKDQLKAAVTARGWKDKVRISTSGCMGLCGTGPNILLYPQGIHFSGVTEPDVPLILDTIDQLLPAAKKKWFVFRRMGYRPCSWQGWLISLGFIALIFAMREWVNPEHYTSYVLLLAAGLIGICIVKGGRTRI